MRDSPVVFTLFLACVIALSSFSGWATAKTVFNKSLDVDLPLNDAPIVGILSQEISYHLNGKWPGEFKSYIAASYVKFIEGGGGRVVPLWIDQPREYYADMLTKVNGVLWPGGATWFNQSNGYADAGRHIYEIAMEMNDRGEHMPIFGTCLGFELLTYVSSDKGDPRADCSSDRQALPLDFEPDFKDSQMFRSASDEVITILQNEPVTPNFHHFCVTKQNLTDFGLDDKWRVLSVNDDEYGLEFISTIEHRRYPFFGTMFHAEKNLYEWIINRNIPHTSSAIKIAQYFANFFVDETRRSQNRFPGGVTEENSVLIYNFHTNFTAMVKSAYEQCYLFDEHATYVKIEGEQFNDNDSVGDSLDDSLGDSAGVNLGDSFDDSLDDSDDNGSACMQSAFVGLTVVVAVLTSLIS